MEQPENSPRSNSDAPADARGNVYQVVAICGLLLLAVGLVFGQTVHHEFVNLDDRANVCLNPHVNGGVTAEEVKWAFTHRYVACWMPLTWISHMLDCQIYGLNAGGHHLTNVLLHAATSVLLFLVLRQMTGRLWPSAFVAAVFAIHPLRVESVAWVTERKDVLSGLFFVLTLGAYAGYVRHRFSFVRYGVVIVLFALGLMAKPMLVTLPFVLLLLDYWPLGRWTAPNAVRLVLEKVPLLALTALSCVMTIWAAAEGVNLLDHRFTLSWRVGYALTSYVSYLGMLFNPANLVTPYPRPSLDLPLWKVFGAGLVLVVLTLAALAARRRHPYLPVGWLWYAGMLLPVSGVLQFSAVTMCDRFTYLPQIGLCLALTWGFADALRSRPCRRLACGTVAVSLVAVLAGLAWRHTSFWRDSVTLWNHALARTSRNGMAHQLLGEVSLRLGQIDKGIDQYQAAIAIEPDHAPCHYNLGVALAGVGRLDEAIEHYQTAARLQPNDVMSHYNLGVALASAGRLDEAIERFQQALRLQPTLAEAHNNLGCALYQQRRFDLALSHFREALRLDPKSAEAHLNIGTVWQYYGRLDDAITEYQRALRADPDFSRAHYVLGVALAKRGKPDEAVVHYRRALAIDPSFIKARRNLDKVTAGDSGGLP
jgi:protein O-mannosyl-transferase